MPSELHMQSCEAVGIFNGCLNNPEEPLSVSTVSTWSLGVTSVYQLV